MITSPHPLKSRRKPVQQRSKMSHAAILEAFVRLLVEKGYEQLTIRDIAMVAGVGLGTVYEYFPSKKSIAAHCIHQRFKGAGARIEGDMQECRGRPLLEMVTQILLGQIMLHSQNVEEWSALIFLERQVSDAQAFRGLYQHIVDLWAQVFQASCDRADYAGKKPEVVHAAVYGLLYQRLMTAPYEVQTEEFRNQLISLVRAYLLA